MLLDKRLSSYDATITSGGQGTGNGNITASGRGAEIDLGQDNVDIGTGEPLVWETHLETADAANADETYVFELKEASNAAFTQNVATIATHTMNRDRSDTPMYTYLQPGRNFRRYLRVDATLGGTSPSCRVTSGLSNQRPEDYKTYPDAISIATAS